MVGKEGTHRATMFKIRFDYPVGQCLVYREVMIIASYQLAEYYENAMNFLMTQSRRLHIGCMGGPATLQLQHGKFHKK